MKRDTRSAYRSRAAATERMVDAAVAEVKAARDAEHAAAKQEYAEWDASRRRFTRDDLINAHHIRTETGWRKVVRLNAKTLTVETGYSWTDLVPFDRVLQVAVKS
jgi:hypothetical protein